MLGLPASFCTGLLSPFAKCFMRLCMRRETIQREPFNFNAPGLINPEALLIQVPLFFRGAWDSLIASSGINSPSRNTA